MKAVTQEERRAAYPFILTFVVLSLGIVVGGIYNYQHYEQQFQAGIEQQLSAIVELKADELAQYRKERLWDAVTFFKNAAFSELARRFLDHPEDTEAQEQLRTWLEKYLADSQNDCLFLLDTQGIERMTVPANSGPISPLFSQRAAKVLQSREIAYHDFHRNEKSQRIYLTLLVPILDGPDYSRPLGVLALRIDPETYLYPLLKRWPSSSRTAETLLVRRDGNDVLYLNELKFATNAALNLRIPLTDTNVPAVKAVLGQTGIVNGVSYSGVPVVAALKAVPDSPWFLVAQIGEAEVYAPLQERLWMTNLLAGALVLCAGVGAGAIWRHQRVRFYKEQYKLTGALRQSEERLRSHTDNSPLAVIEWNADLVITRWTGGAERIFGWSAREAVGKSIVELPPIYEEDRSAVKRVIQQLTAGVSKHALSTNRNRTKDGRIIHCEWYSSILHDAKGKVVSVLSQVLDITERQRAGEALERTRLMLEAVLEQSPVPIMVVNASDLALSYDNPAAIDFLGVADEPRYLGLTLSETQQRQTWRSLHPDGTTIAPSDSALERALFRGEITRNKEFSVIRKDGTQRWGLANATPIYSHSGELLAAMLLCWDVTERKRAEEAMRSSESRLHTLLQTIPDLVWLKDVNGVFLFCNATFERLCGAPESAIVGKTDYDFVEKSVADLFRQHDRAAMAADGPIINEEWLTFATDGYRGLFQTIKAPMRDANGTLVGILGVARDITERKRAEQAVRESRALYHSLVEQMPAGVFRKDVEGRYVLVNDWFCQLRGMKAEEILGKTPEELIAVESEMHGDKRPEISHLLTEGTKHHEQIMRTGEQIETEEEYPAVNGRKRYLRVVKSPVFDAAGKIIGSQGVQFDISEIKRAEEALQESQALYYSLVEQLPVGVFRKDPEGRYVLVNPRFCKLKNMKAEHFLGKTAEEVANSTEAKRERTGSAIKYAALGKNHHEQIMQNGQPIDMIEEYTDADGKKLFVRVLKLPVFGAGGKIIGSQGILIDITGIQKAEDELRRSNEALARTHRLLQAMLDNAPDRIYFKDAESRFLVVSRSWANRFGLADPEDAVGKTDADFQVTERAEEFHADEQRILQTGEPLINKIEKQIAPNGEVGWTSTNKVPMRDAQGKIIGLVGINRDITENKRAEEALRLSEERLLRIITQTRCILNSGYVEGPPDWRERALNPESPFRWDFPVQNEETAQKILPLELGPGEKYQQAWTRSRNHADHVQMNWNSGNAFLNDLPFYRNEFRCTDKYGVGHWMQQFVTVRKIADSRWEVFGITTDISDLKRVETELRWSDTRLQVILESTNDGILAVDSKGEKIIKVNQRFAELWRIPPPLIAAGDNRAMLDFARKQLSDPDEYLKKTQSLYGTDAVTMDTLDFKDGRIFERRGFPMLMDGEVIGRVWSFRDITDRKRQERELNEKNAELERFTYTVSHDLKSPLVTVKTFLGYLEHDLAGSDKERVKQDVAYMHTAAEKMGLLLDELLNLARVGRKMNPAEQVTFKEIAQEAVRLVAGRISTGGAEVQVADAAVVLKGDRQRLMEVWQNLVENACKFMGNQPKPRVEIGVEQRGSEKVFFVRDNGMGIDPRYHAKVFGLFEKLDPKREGTGMGLALVKRIVEMYKGRIWVESGGPGQGANFLFTLPGAVITDSEQSS
jgi:PAS domain S-box-containing protein